MTWRHLLTSSFLAFAVLAFHAGCVTQQRSDEREEHLFNPLADHAGQIEKSQKPRIIRFRFVSVEFNLLTRAASFEQNAANRPFLLLNLFDDATFNAMLDRREVRSDKSFTLFGRVQGIENSQVTLVVEDGVLVGNIKVQDAMYQIRYAGKDVHVVYQIDRRTFPPDSEPVVVPGAR
jgi:hypothetical protein